MIDLYSFEAGVSSVCDLIRKVVLDRAVLPPPQYSRAAEALQCVATVMEHMSLAIKDCFDAKEKLCFAYRTIDDLKSKINAMEAAHGEFVETQDTATEVTK